MNEQEKLQLKRKFLLSIGISEKVIETFNLDGGNPQATKKLDAIKPDDIAEDNEIFVYGPLVNEDDRAFYAYLWGDASYVSAISFRNRLQEISGEPVIRINSPGGSAWELSSIVQAMSEYKEKHSVNFTAINDGLAASAASGILMCCDEIKLSPLSDIMIHLASTAAYGNAVELKKIIKMLENTDDSLLDIYENAMKEKSRDEIKAMVEAETWLSAKEASDLGIGEVTDPPNKDPSKDNPNNQTTDDSVLQTHRSIFFPTLLGTP